MMRTQRLITIPVIILAVSIPCAVHAQSAGDKAAAEQLFNQARDLMKNEDYTAACPKLEASYKLDPALGTLLNLALCYEKTNRLASAWSHYREIENLARRENQEARAEFAKTRAKELEPKLPRLVIQVPEASRIPGLTVERSGQPVETALFGMAAFVDQGQYPIVARAPGHEDFSTTANAVNGKLVTVEIPRLTPKEPGDETDPTSGDDDRTDLTTAPDDSAGTARKSPRRVIGLAVGGAGLAAAVAGLGLGWSAKSTYNDAFDSGLCNRDTLVCTPSGQEQTNSARTRADIATILTGAGAALAVTGAVLYLTAPKAETGLQITPTAGPESVSVHITGRF